MATIDDQAAAFEEMYRTEALSFRRPTERLTGKCKNCEIPTTGSYCCPECREDHQARVNFNRGRVY